MFGHRFRTSTRSSSNRVAQLTTRVTTKSGRSLAELLSQRTALLDSIRTSESSGQPSDWDADAKHRELDFIQHRIAEIQNGTGLASDLGTSRLEQRLANAARRALGSDKDPSVAVTTGEARAHGDEHASWAVALQPCTRNDRKRIRVAFVACLPRSFSELQEARPSLVWGVASSGHTSWHEPPAGWSTQPDSSWDVGHGAWGTESDEAEEVRIATDDVPVFSVVIDLPWSGSLRKRNGIAFKWRWPSGKKDLWFGDPETGRNLSVRASFAQVFHASGDSDGEAEEAEEAKPMRTSDKEDPWEEANLLHGLTGTRTQQLKALLPAEPGRGSVLVTEGTLDCAVNPWLSMNAPLAWPNDVDHDQVGSIQGAEHNAQRSLMHRFDIAASFVRGVALPSNSDAESAVAAAVAAARAAGPSTALPWLPSVLVQAGHEESKLLACTLWLRQAAARLLVWNHNYNVKPREISAAQEKLTAALTDIWLACPWARKAVTLALGSVGRGGDGNQGQRIRDEILSIQSRNHCKGGMMEQWHQKLHNNTSPDDVAICRALLAYLDSGLDIAAYWESLRAAGIDAARLASYDRSITQEPSFSPAQAPQLRRDLQAYLVTLCAVHGGQDLHAAALSVLGYSQVKRKGRSVHVEPVPGIDAERLRELIQALLLLQQDESRGGAGEASAASSPGSSAANEGDAAVSADGAAGGDQSTPMQTVCQRLQLAMAARRMCAEYLQADSSPKERARDVLFLDIALAAHTRTTIESSLDALSAFLDTAFAPGHEVGAEESEVLLQLFRSAVENYALLQADNAQAAACCDELAAACAAIADAAPADRGRAATWALHVLLASMRRLSLVISHDSSRTLQYMQPTSSALATALKLDQEAAQVALEDSVRAMPDAPASQLASAIEPRLRRHLGGSTWRLIASMQGPSVTGRLRIEHSLQAVQNDEYAEATVLLVNQVGGDEDLPRGCVALLCRQQIDVLSHAALRARATGAFVACCSDSAALDAIAAGFDGQQVRLRMNGDEVECAADSGEAAAAPSQAQPTQLPAAEVVKAPALDSDRWVVAPGDDMDAHVGSKCVNLWKLSRSLGPGISVPSAVALPFACLEFVLRMPENSGISAALAEGNVSAEEAEAALLQVKLPEDLRRAVEAGVASMTAGEATAEDVAEVLRATARVWGSKWGARARRAREQLGASLSSIHMSVVLQPLVDAHMAFVSHSSDPRAAGGNSGGGKRVYVEAVVGLGESLVGNVPGQPLAFTANAEEVLRVLRPAAAGPAAPALRCLGAASGALERGGTGSMGLVQWLQGLSDDLRAAAASAVRVESAPGKLWAVAPERGGGGTGEGPTERFYGLIARSASNMEDLAEFSGAGVFDSFPTAGVAYGAAWNASMQEGGLPAIEAEMLAMVLATAEVEVCFDEGDQDVEGVLDCHGQVHVVQARPQV